MLQIQPATTAAATPSSNPPFSGGSTAEARPKQAALAMNRLHQAARIVADIRIGTDRILKALFTASEPRQISKPLHFFIVEDASMRQHLQDLRVLGRQLEESGFLNESLRSQTNSWDFHMRMVCPDGTVVTHAWRLKQLVHLLLVSSYKAFTDQKRPFFPHLDDGLQDHEPASKKHHGSEEITVDPNEELSNLRMLPDVLKCLEKGVPNLTISTFERLDWLKRASSLPSTTNETPLEHNFHAPNKPRPGSLGVFTADKVTEIELLSPSAFRTVVSLHPAGSIHPDSVAFFSLDEGGSHVHASGSSVYHVYRHITDSAGRALQYFLGNHAETSLYFFTGSIPTRLYLQELAGMTFTLYKYSDPLVELQGSICWWCSKCSRVLAMDEQSALPFPPVHRPYGEFSFSKILSSLSSKEQNSDIAQAYHIGCFSEES